MTTSGEGIGGGDCIDKLDNDKETSDSVADLLLLSKVVGNSVVSVIKKIYSLFWLRINFWFVDVCRLEKRFVDFCLLRI